jgi:hypothetical protein
MAEDQSKPRMKWIVANVRGSAHLLDGYYVCLVAKGPFKTNEDGKAVLEGLPDADIQDVAQQRMQ